MVKKTLFGLLLILISIQFIRPARNLGPAPSPYDIQLRHMPTVEVRRLLESACYDCHSNHTNYPWYTNVQPLGWWLASHVSEGKRELNFSEFAKLVPKRAAHKLEEATSLVSNGEMPLASYKLAHAEARLTEAQRKLLADWFDSVRATLPADVKK